jgi:CRISPR-associated exonuclease Cas4
VEDDLLPLSALQHLVFCERQCGLLLIDQVWRDNPLTLEGSRLHRRVHEEAPRREVRGDLLIARGVQLQSLTLGVAGVADVVEFHCVGAPSRGREQAPSGAVRLGGVTGWWRPFPVEYKRGKPKRDSCDEVQLCAQAICIEEMLGVALPDGALFYGTTQHRYEVHFTSKLREQTRHAARRLHELFAGGIVPRVERQAKCRSCSLVDVCRPDATSPDRSVSRYLANVVRFLHREEGVEGV